MGRSERWGLHLVAGGLLVTAAFVACSSGGSSSVPSAPGTGASPVPLNGLPASIPYNGSGYAGALTIPAGTNVPQGDGVTLLISASPFPNTPVLQALGRAPTSLPAGTQVLFYLQLTFSQTTTVSSLPIVTVNLPQGSTPACCTYWMAFYDPTQASPSWNDGFEGPAEVNGLQLTFSGIQSPITFQGGAPYGFALYSLPVGTLTVTPSSVNILGTGSSYAVSLQVQESGYGGTFAESDTCAQIATVSPTSGSGPSATFTVTGVQAGTCTITIADQNNQKQSVPVTVTTNGFTIQRAGSAR
jgi:hypothetical protein